MRRAEVVIKLTQIYCDPSFGSICSTNKIVLIVRLLSLPLYELCMLCVVFVACVGRNTAWFTQVHQ